MKMRSLLCCLTIFLAFATSPVHAKMTVAERNKLVGDLLATVVAEQLKELQQSTANLQLTIEQHCSGPIEFRSTKVKEAFSKTLAAWMRVQHLRFGPMLKDNKHYRFQFWPDKHARTGKQLRQLMRRPVSAMPDPETLAKSSVALQGLPALERLLFGKKGKPEAEKKICKLAISIAENLRIIALEAHQSFAGESRTGDDNSAQILVSTIIEQLQIIENLKLARPLGVSLTEVRPKRSESWRSGQSLQNISNNLAGIALLMNGSGSTRGLLVALSGEEGKGIAKAIAEHLRYGQRIIAQQKEPLSALVTTENGRNFVHLLVSHLGSLRELIIENLAPALDVKLGFNTQDGD